MVFSNFVLPDPSDWYWIVDDDTTQVWSSAKARYVTLTDPLYEEWLESHTPTKIDSEASLFGILMDKYPSGTPMGRLLAMMNGAIQITSSSKPSLNGTYAIDSASRGNITGIATSINAGLGVPGGAETFNYPDIQGQPHQWTASLFIEFAREVMNFVYAISQVLGGHSVDIPSQPITIS